MILKHPLFAWWIQVPIPKADSLLLLNNYKCLLLGCEETLPNSSLFETSHKFLYYAQCSTFVSLVDGQALSSKHGINWMFAKLVSNMDISLNCKVVAKEPARHTVLLSDENQDIGEYLLELYNNGTISYLLTPSPTPSPGIEASFGVLHFKSLFFKMKIFSIFRFRPSPTLLVALNRRRVSRKQSSFILQWFLPTENRPVLGRRKKS